MGHGTGVCRVRTVDGVLQGCGEGGDNAVIIVIVVVVVSGGSYWSRFIRVWGGQ